MSVSLYVCYYKALFKSINYFLNSVEKATRFFHSYYTLINSIDLSCELDDIRIKLRSFVVITLLLTHHFNTTKVYLMKIMHNMCLNITWNSTSWELAVFFYHETL